MTAEIAILNRLGVALAADSAVTISSANGPPKTYNSADKLFPLDGVHPVAIMIHGSAEFMGIPAETIVKGYRESRFNQPQDELSGYACQFAEYMQNELPLEHDTIVARVAHAVVEMLSILRNFAEADLAAAADKAAPKRIRIGSFIVRRVFELVRERTRQLRELPVIEGVSEENLPDELDDIVADAVQAVIGDGLDKRIDPFVEMTRLALTRPVTLGGDFGLVFAGFGESQFFPAIEAFDCDLALVGALRIKPRLRESIHGPDAAMISSFAQNEMVHRFMDGVDHGYVDFMREMMRGALSNFGNEVGERLGVKENRKSRAMAKRIEALRDAYVDELDRAAETFRKINYRQKILEVVQFMPKAELAEMAESLVNLTSIKRRVSAEHESVGGPIDVAFVSKHDGFAWVRRKGMVPGDAGGRA